MKTHFFYLCILLTAAAFAVVEQSGDSINKLAVGSNTLPSYQQTVQIGYNAKADCPSGTAIGHNAYAGNNLSVAVGWNSVANGTQNTAVGSQSGAVGGGCTAVGRLAYAQADQSVVLGGGSQTYGIDSVAIGHSAIVGVGASFAAQIGVGSNNIPHVLKYNGRGLCLGGKYQLFGSMVEPNTLFIEAGVLKFKDAAGNIKTVKLE